MKNIIPILSLSVIFSCTTQKTTDTTFDYAQLEHVADSVKVGNIVILNSFKHQMLAHKNNQYDPARIINKVYKPHQKLWDSCYAVIFGDENAHLFNTPKGMAEWNNSFYQKNRPMFEEKTKILLGIDLKKTFEKSLVRFNKLVPFQPKARISLVFTPITGIAFGGCSNEQFALELNNKGIDIPVTLKVDLPHELNHMVYEQFRNADPDHASALNQTIDEGFACYFTYVFFEGKLQKHETIHLTQKEWDWFISNEKQLFTQLKTYFADTSGKNPLLLNEKIRLFPEAPKNINYWMGFRIIEKYVEKNGPDSWKDVYRLTAKDLLQKSGYEQYIESL